MATIHLTMLRTSGMNSKNISVMKVKFHAVGQVHVILHSWLVSPFSEKYNNNPVTSKKTKIICVFSANW